VKITSESKRGKGRPPLLQLDDETVRKIENLARIQCTEEEAAAVLAVSQPTLNRFLNNNEKAMEAWQNGAKSGRASVRRWQFKSAEGGNVTMQIWLGKQLLQQSDKSDVNHGVQDSLAQLMNQIDGTAGRIPTARD
jgi:predicted transcriptional regulator